MARDMADLSMLELFRMEAGNHTAVLVQGLPQLGIEFSKESVKPLIDAAMSLKGAAKIVGLAEAVSLAGAMEGVLEQCRSEEIAPSEELVEILLSATSFLSALAEVEVEEMDNWLEKNVSGLNDLLNRIESNSPQGGNQEFEVEAQERSDTPEEGKLDDQGADSEAEDSPAPVKEEVPLADASMLDLFRMEAESHSQSLSSGLVELEKEQSPEKVEPLMRAAHSLKGAARIVGLDDVVKLSHAAEDVLEACRKGERILSGIDIDRLLVATDFFAEIAAIPSEDLGRWLADNSGAMLAATLELENGTESAVDSFVPEETALPEPAEEQNSVSDLSTLPVNTPAPVKEEILLADASMLDLFRMEAESHSQSLSSGLVELEKEQSPEKVEPLMRAAHSLKGAARIVGLDDVVKLSHAAEDVLEACRKGERILSGTDIDRLLVATDFFAEIAAIPSEDLGHWLADNSGAMLAATSELENGTESAVDSFVPEETALPEPAEEQNSVSDLSTIPVNTPAPAKEDIPLADLSMLDLFRMEAESHSQSLTSGLLELEKDQSPDKVEPLMRAAHSLKGAARIVGLTDAVALAHAMEDLLVACQKGETILSSTQIDILLSATDIYKDVSLIDTDEIQGYLSGKKPLMDRMEKALRGDEQAVAEVCSAVCPSGVPASAVEEAPSPLLPTAEELAPEALKPEVNGPADEQKASVEQKAKSSQKDSVVRVSAANLNRLMALAGESLVEAGRLGSFATSLLRIKSGQRDLMKSLEEGCERVIRGESPAEVLGELKNVLSECQSQVVRHIDEFDLYRRRSDNISGRLYHEVIASRMRPFSDGGRGFPRLVRDLARSLGKEVDFVIEGENTSVDRDILDMLEAPLNHLIRNAVDHGIELADERIAAGKPANGTIKVIAGHRAGMLFIEIRDDGKGIDPERIRDKVVERKLAPARMAAEMSRAELMEFLFLPGFSTAGKVTEISGRGVGLDVVHAMVQEVGGTVRAESDIGHGMTFSMQLPLTLSVIRTLLVDISGQPYAIPLSRISRIASVAPSELQLVEDRQYISLNGSNVGLVTAAQILGTTPSSGESDVLKVVVISDRMNKYGLVIDGFLGEQDLVVRPLDHRLGKVPDVNSVALMPDGSPVLILDAEDLVRSIDNLLSGGRLGKVGLESSESAPVQKILVVDDSLTVREVERKLLANSGYEVDTAVDGQDGFNAVLAGKYDLVVTDVDMPRMNGLELTRRIKSDPDLKSIPVMMVSYKDRKEDKLRGLEAGADYYLTKSSFHDETLLSAVEDLIGRAGK